MKKIIPSILCLFFLSIIAETSFAQWVHQNSGTTDILFDVFFPTKDTGYVSGVTPNIIKTTNGGANWNVLPNSPAAASIYFTSRDTGFATADDTIFKTVNGGSSWTTQFSNSAFTGIGAIYFSDKLTGYTTGLSNDQDTMYFIKTVNGGNTWNVVSWVTGAFFSTPMTSISFVNRDTGCFVGNSFQIYRTLNGCASVSSVFSSVAVLSSIHFPTKDTGYAVGYPDALVKSVNMGASWNIVPTSGNNEFYYDVFFTTKDTGFLAVDGGTLSYGKILKTTDGGNNWITQITDTAINALYFPTQTIGYAVGTNGTILKYTGIIGIDENTNDGMKFVSYPNPTNGTFNIKTKSEDIKNISIYNIHGEEILHKEKLTSRIIPVDISLHLPGIYFIILTDSKGNRLTEKIVKDN